ncbi:MAG: sugar phosphate isomerase/epimerase [Planctomycetota bacterium]|nr:sugar phosphate isomerase/epimerase [Planctomycetota bacterium]
MEIGFLTACMRKQPVEEVVAFAGREGFTKLELSVGHVDLDGLAAGGAAADKLKELLAAHKVGLSSLAAYVNVLDTDAKIREKNRADLRKAIAAAKNLGVSVVCTLGGLPPPGISKADAIRDQSAPFFRETAKCAADAGVRIAFENWFATVLENLDLWKLMFDLVPDPNVGLNFDPSHLDWMGIDYLAAVTEFKDRIFHTHAKDTEVREDVLRRVGCNHRGWWRYVIPGYGRIKWGEYVARLRSIKYDGVLSVEHEDNTFTPEAGLRAAMAFLKRFAIG